MEKCGIQAFEYDVTDSTNQRAKEFAKEVWDGKPTLFLADEQTQGRGRYSRKFYSEKGVGVYLSLLFKPNSSIKDTTAVIAHTANSMILAIEKLCRVRVNIKWVNDLILNGKKLGGILIEGAINPKSKSYDYLIAGIGVNLYAAEMDEEIKNIATSVEAESGVQIDKNALISLFLRNFFGANDGEAANKQNEQDHYNSGDACYRLYKSRLITLGKAVTVKTVTEEYDATATDLLPDYSLLVTLPDGTQKRIFTGEVSVRTH